MQALFPTFLLGPPDVYSPHPLETWTSGNPAPTRANLFPKAMPPLGPGASPFCAPAAKMMAICLGFGGFEAAKRRKNTAGGGRSDPPGSFQGRNTSPERAAEATGSGCRPFRANSSDCAFRGFRFSSPPAMIFRRFAAVRKTSVQITEIRPRRPLPPQRRGVGSPPPREGGRNSLAAMSEGGGGAGKWRIWREEGESGLDWGAGGE